MLVRAEEQRLLGFLESKAVVAASSSCPLSASLPARRGFPVLVEVEGVRVNPVGRMRDAQPPLPMPPLNSNRKRVTTLEHLEIVVGLELTGQATIGSEGLDR